MVQNPKRYSRPIRGHRGYRYMKMGITYPRGPHVWLDLICGELLHWLRSCEFAAPFFPLSLSFYLSLSFRVYAFVASLPPYLFRLSFLHIRLLRFYVFFAHFFVFFVRRIEPKWRTCENACNRILYIFAAPPQPSSDALLSWRPELKARNWQSLGDIHSIRAWILQFCTCTWGEFGRISWRTADKTIKRGEASWFMDKRELRSKD